ncbi:unnamed protein product [Spodoptera littoralis]|uniref:Uncharacterized protein n=1 Tax=Spodoptera littoralis TaxID=7109 RepID=A0A9P0MZN7_SPOLI|nr:unnamed protein product [Spodoptera littoralis]CAH1636245.1 unnamed protein product [Spodoptera littoralis]
MSSKPLIVNELLAFLVHAIDYMDEVSILQICRSNYKEEEVSSAKLLLFQSLGKLDQMPSRRRDGTEKSLQDIIDMLKKTDPDDVPDFVARELSKLPPVTFDHVDVTRLLKDITSLKGEMTKMQSRMEESDKIIADLRAEITTLRNTGSVIRSPEVSKVNTRRGAQNATIGSFESANTSVLSTAKIADEASLAVAVTRTSTPAAVTSHIGTTTPTRAYADIVAKKTTALQTKRPTEKGIKQKSCQHACQKQQVDRDGFITVQKKKKKSSQNKCGTAPTGPKHLLRPAVPGTLLYVSRLHYSTKVEEIVEYIQIKTNYTLRVLKLESHHSVNFNSFVVRVPSVDLPKFMTPEFWPKGVVFRRFRGRIPDTAQHTTPTQHNSRDN